MSNCIVEFFSNCYLYSANRTHVVWVSKPDVEMKSALWYSLWAGQSQLPAFSALLQCFLSLILNLFHRFSEWKNTLFFRRHILCKRVNSNAAEAQRSCSRLGPRQSTCSSHAFSFVPYLKRCSLPWHPSGFAGWDDGLEQMLTASCLCC